MPSSGSGTGTPVGGTPTQATIPTFPLPLPDSCITLSRYANLISQPECGFFGVSNPADADKSCQEIWSLIQRLEVAKYLSEAQDEIEQQTHYPLCPTWFADEQKFWRDPVKPKWGKVIEAGVQAESDIAVPSAISYATEPAIIGPIVTTVTDVDEVRIFYPDDSDREITPVFKQISGGSVTIWVPRCRMVAPNLLDNPSTGLDFNDLTNFLADVDVKRIFNDPSTNAEWVWPHRCTTNCSTSGCTDFSQDACIYVRNNEIGSLGTRLAKFNVTTQVWARTTAQCCSGRPEIIKINYKAGLDPISPQAEDAVLRLAHSKMPDEICGCQTFTRMWKRDRNVPEAITPERASNPFGLNDGAWAAWQFTKSLRLVRGAVL